METGQATEQATEQQTADPQMAIVKQLGELLVQHDIDAKVEVFRETVCALAGAEVQDKAVVKVVKDMPAAQAEKAAAFTAAAKALPGAEGVQIKVVAKLGAGDPYQTIKNIVPMGDGAETADLAHDGQAWLLDFWATWCPPCQRPMAHNQEMLTKRAEDWKGKVRIIGLSIDSDMPTLKKHVEAKGWTSVEHFWRAQSDASQVYGVNGVPHVMLIDKNGTIVFKGHPASRPDLEADLDKLAAGEALTGEGVFSGPKAGGEEAPAEDAKEEEGFAEVDAAAINAEIDGFKAVAEGLQADAELKDKAQQCPRAFCVMVFQQKYNPKTQSLLGKYENYRVLVGPQATIDSIKTTLEEKVTGSFEVVLREQAV